MSSFSWPVITSANPSVGGTGIAAPNSATEVAGVDGNGDLRAISVTQTGEVNVNITGSTTTPFPVTDAAAEASLASIDAKTPALGQGLMAASTPVAIASNQSAIPVSQSGAWSVSVSSSALPTGAATEAKQDTEITALGTVNTSIGTMSAKLPATLGQKTMANSMAVVLASDQASVPVAATQSGTWTVQPGNTANTTAWLVSETVSASSSVSSVASSASNVTLLSSNASRKNATFYNESTQILYLKLGTTASTSSYTIQIPASGYYELPIGKIYTGQIDGIWASANGNVRITELS